MSRLHIDFETFSKAPLASTKDEKSVGTYNYSKDPSTEILCMAFAYNDDPVRLIPYQAFNNVPGLYCSEDTWDAIFDFTAMLKDEKIEVAAHNVFFEYWIHHNILMRKGLPEIAPSRWFCTMGKAAAYNLPLSLDILGRVLNVNLQKDTEGSKIMKQLCKPRKPTKPLPYDRFTVLNSPEMYERLYAYCIRDVETEREIDKMLPELSPTERELFQIDFQMNLKGIKFDLDTIDNIINLLGRYDAENTILFNQLTGLNSVREYKQLAKFLKVESVAKDKIKDYLENPRTYFSTVERYRHKLATKINSEPCQNQAKLNEAIVEFSEASDILKKRVYPKSILRLIQQLNISSISKYQAMKRMCDKDGYFRNGFQYNAAFTGRWAGRGVQVQNLPRGGKLDFTADEAITLINNLTYDEFIQWVPDVNDTMKDIIRSMITPSVGNKLIVGDLAQIECRVLAWLAGQTDLVEAFRRGEDVYIQMASTIYTRPAENIPKKSEERQLGKQTILGSGYGMGPSRFVVECKLQAGLIVSHALAAKAIQSYRKKYTHIVKFWKLLENTAILAVKNPGQRYQVGKIFYQMRRGHLYCQLPSGREIMYPFAYIALKNKNINGKKFTNVTLHYYKMHEGKWVLTTTYGGMMAEHVASGTARDIIAHGMTNLSKRGYGLILTVHDETGADVPRNFGSVEEFEEIMTTMPPWAQGCPVEAEVELMERYRK